MPPRKPTDTQAVQRPEWRARKPRASDRLAARVDEAQTVRLERMPPVRELFERTILAALSMVEDPLEQPAARAAVIRTLLEITTRGRIVDPTDDMTDAELDERREQLRRSILGEK